MDMVLHCGAVKSGSCMGALVFTEAVIGWTERAPLVVRSRALAPESRNGSGNRCHLCLCASIRTAAPSS